VWRGGGGQLSRGGCLGAGAAGFGRWRYRYCWSGGTPSQLPPRERQYSRILIISGVAQGVSSMMPSQFELFRQVEYVERTRRQSTQLFAAVAAGLGQVLEQCAAEVGGDAVAGAPRVGEVDRLLEFGDGHRGSQRRAFSGPARPVSRRVGRGALWGWARIYRPARRRRCRTPSLRDSHASRGGCCGWSRTSRATEQRLRRLTV
jgi:hypothetical protein